MKKSFTIAILSVLLLAFSAPNARADGADDSGGILAFIGFGAGCGASAATAPCSSDPSSGLFSSIACTVMKAFNAGTIPIYCSIVSNPEYLAAIDAAMALYVIFLGISFMYGLVPMRAGVLIGKLIKVVIVYSIVINSDLYFGLIYNTVLQTPQDVVQILLNSNTGSGSGTGSQNFFQYVDQALYSVLHEIFYSQADPTSGNSYGKANLKIFVLGMALWQLGGDLIGGLFFSVVIGWLMSYFSIMVRYLLAMLSLMFVLMLGPIFIPTLLFEQTKYLFEEWLYMILNFIMQIVLVVAFILMVQGFFIDFYNMIKAGLNQSSMPTSAQPHLVPFNNQNALNPNPSDGAYRSTLQQQQYTPQAAQQFFSQAFGGNYQQLLPQMVFKLIETLVIIMASMAFIAYVPALGALLVGRAQFIRLFQGDNFTGTAFKKSKEQQADLLGQNSGRPSSGDAIGALLNNR